MPAGGARAYTRVHSMSGTPPCARWRPQPRWLTSVCYKWHT